MATIRIELAGLFGSGAFDALLGRLAALLQRKASDGLACDALGRA